MDESRRGLNKDASLRLFNPVKTKGFEPIDSSASPGMSHSDS